MTYDELFSGETVWLGRDCDPGWRVPFLVVKAEVEMEVQRKDLDPLETPDGNLVVDIDPKVETTWGYHDGWPGFAVLVQHIGELLSYGQNEKGDKANLLEALEQVVRDPGTWATKSKHYSVLWKGEEVEGI